MDDARDDGSMLADQLLAGRPRWDGALDGLRARVLAGIASRGPRMVGRYRLGRAIGSGAFGTVYEAEDPDLERRVAIKLFAPSAARETQRVLREARMLATVSAPNVVHVFEVGTVDDATAAPYLVMELVEGPTLREHLAVAPRPWREVLALVLDAARGLWAAHQHGVVHRDFKPDNVILATDGRPRVVDFGLARSFAADDDDETTRGRGLAPHADVALTPTGHALGTPAYMAPEAFTGPCTPGCDQYSLCVALFEGLFGARPFAVRTTEELLAKISREDPAVPRDRRGVPAAVIALVMRGLDRDPGQRHRDLGALVAALERAARPRTYGMLWLGVGGAATVLAVAGLGATAEVCATGEAAWAKLGPGDDARSQAAYAARWRQTEQSLCDAGAMMTAAQRHCLDRRMGDVIAVREVLATLEPDARAVLDDPFAGLPAPEDCVAPSGTDGATTIVTDPAAVARLESAASHLRALMIASQPALGLAISPGLLAEARTVGHPPLLAEIAHAHARTLLLASQYREAAVAFEEAFHLAQAAGLDHEAARAACDLLRLHGHFLGDTRTARRWAAHADAAFARVGVDPKTSGVYNEGLASLAEREGDLEGAEAMLRQAIATAEGKGAARHGMTGGLHNRLGFALLQRDRPADALAAFTVAASIFAASNGAQSLPRASALDNAGVALGRLGRSGEALPHHEEALAIREALLADDHPDTGASLGNMAEVLERLGRRDEAAGYIDRALVVFTRRLGAEHPHVATGLEIRARILAGSGDRDGARVDLEKAARIFAAAGPEYAASVAELQAAIAALDPSEAR